MKFRSLGAGLSCAAVLAAGACDTGPQAPAPDYGPLTADSWFQEGDTQRLTATFDASVAVFVGRGITDMSDIELVLIEGGATPRCGDIIFTANGPGPAYCGEALYINAKFVNVTLRELARKATDDPARQQEILVAAREYVVGHELGHAVQDIEGAINEPAAVYQPSKEPQADCYSGEVMRSLAPEHIDEVVSLLEQFPQQGDLAHGSPSVRIAALNLGFSGSDCDARKIVEMRFAIEDQQAASSSPTPA